MLPDGQPLNLPLQLKALIPGYRGRWRYRHACLLAEIAALAPRLDYGEDNGTPWIELKGGLRLFGFPTEPANAEIHRLLREDLPADLPPGHFRLVKDCVTRYVYPHMRPDLKPAGFAAEQMFGFHGQHKDTIADLGDAAARAALAEAFRPRHDEVVVDCGCFLGFGELRLAPEMPQGHIYAIEADERCYALLARNLAWNGIKNVTPLHRGVWSEETELDLGSGFAQANSLVGEVHEGDTARKVRTIALDGLVHAYGLQRVDMVSLTLNGAEVEALDGAAEMLSRLRPRIRLAGWYARGGKKIWQIAKARLEAFDYRVHVGPRGNLMALPAERLENRERP